MNSIGNFIRAYVAGVSIPKSRTREAPSVDLPEAHIRWGKPSDLSVSNVRDELNRGFRAVDPEHPPLWGTYQEEGRAYSMVDLVDPENPTLHKVPLRQTTAVAFHPVRTSFIEPKRAKDQIVFTAHNSYTEGNPRPVYLKNTQGEEFDPYVLDPWTSIVEVGWPRNDFVLISIIIKPRTHVDFELHLDEPRDKDIFLPDNESGPDDNTYQDHLVAANPNFELKPFMETWQNGNVIDPHEQTDEDTLLPLGVQGVSVPDVPATVLFTAPMNPASETTKNGILLNLPVDVEFETLHRWTNLLDSPCNDGETVPNAPAPGATFDLEDYPPNVGNAIGCYSALPPSAESEAPRNKPGAPYFITNSPNNGALFKDPTTGVTHQWVLDVAHTHQATSSSSSAFGGASLAGAFKAIDGNGGVYTRSYVFRKWATQAPKDYDDNPFVYALFMVDVSHINKTFLQEILESERAVEFSIHAGNADDAAESQGVDGLSMGGQIGKIRWVWVKGSEKYREAAAEMMSINFDFAPGEEVVQGEVEVDAPPSGGGDPELPTLDEVWAALRDGTGYLAEDVTTTIQEGILNEEESDFPAGISIEGDVRKQVSYLVDFGGKKLTVEND